ncbi:hypothetical protein EC957_001912 [Mortierella hygrophila]|uniref:Uncharacterized protein n=1 Tax=Mortierella hygrophila TaxID=979708 RepID=A0A9P6F5X3_9FUNG|nr:hypothetical protein EC957_001912 [Mortierella hygrophila]
MIDDLIPPAAVKFLHKKLTGRFRPIVTAIRGDYLETRSERLDGYYFGHIGTAHIVERSTSSSKPLRRVTTVSYQLYPDIILNREQELKLAISHRNITTHDFMKAHVENGSKLLEGSDVEKAPVTVSGNIIQGNMDKEHEELLKEQAEEDKKANRKQKSTESAGSAQPLKLQDYCPTGVYISMVITYPAEVVRFQVVRPDPKPELEGLELVSINIDDNNFP